jgi:hypothetical protein
VQARHLHPQPPREHVTVRDVRQPRGRDRLETVVAGEEGDLQAPRLDHVQVEALRVARDEHVVGETAGRRLRVQRAARAADRDVAHAVVLLLVIEVVVRREHRPHAVRGEQPHQDLRVVGIEVALEPGEQRPVHEHERPARAGGGAQVALEPFELLAGDATLAVGLVRVEAHEVPAL